MITTSLDNNVYRVTLDRPDRRNALTPDMIGRLVRAIADASQHPGARSILLDGAGPVFCAGFDLELCAQDPDNLRALLRGLHDAIAGMRASTLPVVVAAHGAAIAGGCALLGGADLVVSHNDCTMGYPVLALGVSPAVSAPFLVQSMHDGGARANTLLPELFDGSRAHTLGLVHVLAADARQVGHVAMERARALADKPAHAVRATKAILGTLDRSGEHARTAGALRASLGLAGNEESRRLLGAWVGRPR